MTEWANYDADGKRAPSDSKRAVFRAKEVSVDTGVLPHLVMRAWKASNIGMCTPSIGPTWARPSSHSLGCSDGSRSMLQAQRARRSRTDKRPEALRGGSTTLHVLHTL
jgi:hypothetical protein